jgi:hypothetical protein
MKSTPILLPFGQHKGKDIRCVPDDYLTGFLCERGKGTYYKSIHSLDKKWQVPIWVWEAARKEAERRGFKKIGTRWERDEA